ncbi:pyridoxamine 5'-phosphate oxidase family protein [Geomicrobium sp. JSM 1781026]|uniref:pyridoxamine 5'-phosphate oxidase family protein n=1 Tax=Geomicrobium sp. JSM 1781026 TaxID=3344580 RepID=UPI0035C0A073
MKVIRDRKKSFDLDAFLQKPQFAHLATVTQNGAPRESPVWFYWDGAAIWVIGNPASDSFLARITDEPRCAIGFVEMEKRTGKVWHAGFRGHATVEPFDRAVARQILKRYLGDNEEEWDPRFQNLDSANRLLHFVPETVVVRDQSFEPSLS